MMYLFNKIFILISAGDKVIRLTGIGFKEFFMDKLNSFDTIVVVLSVFELFILTNQVSAVSAFRSVRLFRIFRVLRFTKVFKKI